MSESTYQAIKRDPVDTTHGVIQFKFDSTYAKSSTGKLRILEALLCLLVFICATVAVRNYAVFYGCAVWGSVVGFICMVITVLLLLTHSTSISCPIFETVYCACAALSFLIAGVLLLIVADAAITIPRGHHFRSSLIGDTMTLHEAQVLLGPLSMDNGGRTVHWLVQSIPANAHEYRAALCAAVFSFTAMLLFSVDAYLSNAQRGRRRVVSSSQFRSASVLS